MDQNLQAERVLQPTPATQFHYEPINGHEYPDDERFEGYQLVEIRQARRLYEQCKKASEANDDTEGVNDEQE